MSPTRVTWARTIGRTLGLFSTAASVGCFLAAVAASFFFSLKAGEGGQVTLPAVWASSVSPLLPVLAALLGMDVWSDERRTGRLDVLLATAVRERDFVLGKLLGVMTLMSLTVVFSLSTSLAALWLMAPDALAGFDLLAFVPALFILLLQGALWCAVSVAASALFCHSALAALMSVVLTVGLPRALWAALLAWSSVARRTFGEMPLDEHVADFASGFLSLGTVLSYVIVTVATVFVSVKFVCWHRLLGRGGLALRVTTVVSVLLAAMASALATALAVRMDVTVDCPRAGLATSFSPRTRNVLADSSGDVSVTCFLSRKDPRFRPLGIFLRAIRREAAALGGARVSVKFVDPTWDLGPAERLVAKGVAEESLVFEKGRRTVILSLKEDHGERVCAAAIRQLTTPALRRNVYWTKGHGESAFDDYGTFGFSDIARDLSREGYRNSFIELAQDRPVPGDCALIVIAGPKREFSRAELGRLDAYLREGGRLLVLMNAFAEDGVASLLSTWGLRPQSAQIAGAKTLTGADMIVPIASDHALASPLNGSRLVLERPGAFVPSVTAEVANGADSIGFSALASVGQTVLAAVVERGAGVGSDLTIRPTRIIAVGDPTFVMNGPLAARANANRDFFLNCIAYLSGTDAYGSSGAESDLLVIGMDYDTGIRFLAVTVVGIPFVVFVAMLIAVIRRRRRI